MEPEFGQLLAGLRSMSARDCADLRRDRRRANLLAGIIIRAGTRLHHYSFAAKQLAG
jgi:hypothetical protein